MANFQFSIVKYLLVVAGLLALLFFVGCRAEEDATPVADTAAATSPADLASGTNKPTKVPEVISNLTGRYAVQGTNPDGTTYEGTLDIMKPGEFYTVQWQIGDAVITGTAIVEQNVFSVSWGGAECAALSYEVMPDGSLDGLWFWANYDSLGTEYIAPLDDGSESLLVGTHEMTGVDPAGNYYDGTAEISISGAVYTIIWRTGGDVLPATGIRQGDIISVGWGADSCSVGSYAIAPDGKLNGIWTNVGESRLGTETGQEIGR